MENSLSKWKVLGYVLIGFCFVVLLSASSYAAGVDTVNNNFTIADPAGNTFGGTNDVHFTWDGTMKTSVATSGQVSNATISSTCPFFGVPWAAHDLAIYGPGTYTIYDGCAAGSPGCGSGNPVTFTVGLGQLGGHMLFYWNGNDNIDVVNVWQPGVFAPSAMWTGACGSNPATKVWDMMSTDWDGDGINGAGMTDGPFFGSNASFNLMGVPVNQVVDGTNNNFTMIDATGVTFGGTNDVHFTWDGTKKTSVAVSGQVSNATISSTCSFFGHTWAAHDVAIYGPGTYTIYDGCAAGSPGCGVGNPVTFTVGSGQLGGHMLFSWNGTDNMDVVDVWQPGVFAPSSLWTGACGSNPANKVWDMMSTDWDGDGINGAPMTDGPFVGSNANFNMAIPVCGSCVPADCNDNNPCTSDTCSCSGCVHIAINCNDNNACTADSCDPATGACVHMPIAGCCNTAADCNDNNVCTTDTCVNHVCGHILDNDGFCCPCDSSSGICDPVHGCPLPFCGTPCNDNNACTNDICDQALGFCIHTAVNCNDSNACTADSCNPAIGCVHTPISCDDNNACTADSCSPATGCGHTPIGCDDGNPCTLDSCNPTTGCIHTPVINCNVVVDTVNNNFTMVDAAGSTFGGTNDVHFTWDGTTKTSVAVFGQVSNATISSTCPFFGATWAAHDVAIYGPGTYTIYDGCAAGSPGCGVGNAVTFTVGSGQLGGHLLFYWNGSDNIDVVNVWQPGVFAPSSLWTGACGSNPANRFWDMMSIDWNIDGINGGPMTDGPTNSMNPNFNLMGTAPVNKVVDTINNNFTIIDPTGATFGGANDVHFTWDGTKKISVAASGQVSNATISSTCPFFGQTWAAHDVAIYGPGTYTVYDGCAAGSPGCGVGNPVTFTVGLGQLGGHMLFMWGGTDNMDVVNVWQPGVFAPSILWTGACGSNPANKVWDMMSTDWDGDGINGAPMTDGPFAGTNASFNLMGRTANPCDGIDCNDSNACTIDTCDPATGVCVHTPIVCNDGNACTIDSCNPAIGCVFTAINCNDNNACTTDSCNPATGCVHTAINCDDNNFCTADSCDPAGGCVNTPIPGCVVCAPGSPSTVTLVGGGQNPNTVDTQIQTSFTVLNHSGCIVSTTKSSVTVSVGTTLQYDVTAGPGPQPSDCNLAGSAVLCGTNQITLLDAVTVKLILDNKANGGSDTDRITISAQ